MYSSLREWPTLCTQNGGTARYRSSIGHKTLFVCLVLLQRDLASHYTHSPNNPPRSLQLPYEQTSIITEDSLFELNSNGDVGDLRDAAGADLVQMVGFFNDGNCGLA